MEHSCPILGAVTKNQLVRGTEMPIDTETGLETYPSYDRLLELLRNGASPEDDNLQMLAWVVASNMTKHMGWIVTPEEIMADAVKQAAKA